jgi:hypothetical protein
LAPGRPGDVFRRGLVGAVAEPMLRQLESKSLRLHEEDARVGPQLKQ